MARRMVPPDLEALDTVMAITWGKVTWRYIRQRVRRQLAQLADQVNCELRCGS